MDHVLGDEWSPRGRPDRVPRGRRRVNQIGFNWTAFFRARGETRPIAVVELVLLAGVLAIAVPLLLEEGLEAYGAGWVAATVLAVLVRFGYLRRLFPLPRITADLARALLPTVPAVAAVHGCCG